jgi:hypothetical protein
MSVFTQEPSMNPSMIEQPMQLFGAFMHAGGWPKLGWCQADAEDEAYTVSDVVCA